MQMLTDRNIDTQKKAFMEKYNRATSVFNNFFGPLMLAADNAFHEALDAYEGTPAYRFKVKQNFKRVEAAYNKWWGDVRTLFEDRYHIFIDYCTTAVGQIESDTQKLYWCVKSSLMKMGNEDSSRLAWVVASHLLTVHAVAAHKRFCEDILNETNMPLLPQCFAWADPVHLEHISHDLLDSLCPSDVIRLNEDAVLALGIVCKRLVSHEWQDRAAVATLYLDDYKQQREELAEDIEYYEQREEERRRAEAEANEAYYQRKEEERRRKEAAGIDYTEILATKYNVRRL